MNSEFLCTRLDTDTIPIITILWARIHAREFGVCLKTGLYATHEIEWVIATEQKKKFKSKNRSINTVHETTLNGYLEPDTERSRKVTP